MGFIMTKIKYLIAGIIFSFYLFFPLVAVIFIQDLPSPSDLLFARFRKPPKSMTVTEYFSSANLCHPKQNACTA